MPVQASYLRNVATRLDFDARHREIILTTLLFAAFAEHPLVGVRVFCHSVAN